MTQSWHDLLFAHWPVDARALQDKLPAGLPLDTFDGQAWVGVVPFRMTNVAPRGVPAVPFVSSFVELNVRTYVTLHGKPGVYFFSLDANSTIAVTAARAVRAAVLRGHDAARTARGTAPVHERARNAHGRRRRVRRDLPPDRRDGDTGARLARALPHRAVLPLYGGQRLSREAAGHSPPALAAAGRGGDDCGEHDGRCRGYPSAIDGASAALRPPAGHGRVAAAGRRLVG